MAEAEGSSEGGSPGAAQPAAAAQLTGGDAVVNVDGERSLVAIRASEGSAEASLGSGQLSASLAVGAFEIEDLLVGPKCPDHAYLARSFVPSRASTLSVLIHPLA
jgi:hypothetical protein